MPFPTWGIDNFYTVERNQKMKYDETLPLSKYDQKCFLHRFLLIRFVTLLVILFTGTTITFAHQPFIEKDASVKASNSVEELYARATPIPDPTVASQSIYGRLSSPTEIDLYTFTAAQGTTLPVEALVPVNPANQNFRPAVILIGEDIPVAENAELPLPLPAGYGAKVIAPPSGDRSIFYEKFSVERLYHGREAQWNVAEGKQYFIALYEPGHQVGGYALGLGTTENFSNTSYPALVKNIVESKLGLAGERFIPWLDMLGIFIFLLGFICGLGSIFVLAMTKTTLSKDYGHTAAIINRVTQGLMWFGLLLSIGGAAILYRASKLSGVAFFQAVIALILLLILIYYGWRISPRLNRMGNGAPSARGTALKRRADFSLFIAMLAWMSGLFLLCWYLVIFR